MQPLDSAAPLIVYLDFKSPYAYLAVEPTRRMLAQQGAVADWRPFVLDIPSYLGSAKLGKSGEVKEQNRSTEQWSGVKYAYFDCRRYANLRGLTVRGTVKIWNTDLAAIGMFWVKQQESLDQQCQPDSLLSRYIDAIYEPFWKRELDVEQLQVIEGVLIQIGADVTGFRDYALGVGEDFNAEFQEAAFAAGVYGVPTYIVADTDGASTHRYFGREHLPRIAWHLAGAQDRVPDVAYESVAGAQRLGPAAKRLAVCVDFKSPAAYLAVQPTIDMARDIDAQLDWQVIATPALREPAEPGSNPDRGVLHKAIRGRYLAEDLQRYAPHALVNLYDTQRSDLAATGLLWVIDQHADADAYICAVFARYWRQHEGIDTAMDIAEVLAALGIEVVGFAAFAEGLGKARAEAMREEIAAQGVSSSPTYLIDGEPFQGRQHLPLLRNMIAGV